MRPGVHPNVRATPYCRRLSHVIIFLPQLATRRAFFDVDVRLGARLYLKFALLNYDVLIDLENTYQAVYLCGNHQAFLRGMTFQRFNFVIAIHLHFAQDFHSGYPVRCRFVATFLPFNSSFS